jgi:hypothetical protein
MSVLRIPRVLEREHTDEAVQLLRAYFGPDGQRSAYTGAYFETLGSPWTESPNAIMTADIVAVSALSVDVPPRASIAILDTDATRISELLADIPNIALVAAPEALVDGGAPADLWKLLREMPGIGPTTASKLLARKRPLLAPIFDSVVAAQYGIEDSRGYWRAMRELVRTDQLWERADALRVAADVSALVSPLRVIDIVVWMHGKREAS